MHVSTNIPHPFNFPQKYWALTCHDPHGKHGQDDRRAQLGSNMLAKGTATRANTAYSRHDLICWSEAKRKG
jgi:hypothetical protein